MKRVAMALVRFYQRFLSALKPVPSCRFTPTCSQYALEAFEKRGFCAGFVLMVWRILRCSPLSPAGYDPVPLSGFRTMPMRWSKYDRMKAEGAFQDEAETVEDSQTENASTEETPTASVDPSVPPSEETPLSPTSSAEERPQP